MNICLDSNQNNLLSYPSGSLPIDSPFYVERLPMEKQVYQEINKSGALVRIKAPKEMGKTSLLLRILHYGKTQGYCTVNLNLEQVEEAILRNLNRFLRWLCANVALQLNLEPKLDDFWDQDIGSKVSCSLYFRTYILPQINSPLILALDEVNRIFEYPQVAKDFFPLLRSWYEEGKRNSLWQNLRLIVVHSTEIYVPLQLQQSPFNVGLPVQLNGFNQEEVEELAQRYGIPWKNNEQVRRLRAMIGGHPALVQIALYHLSREDITLSELIKTAHTSTGIFARHLQRYQVMLQADPELSQVFNAIINANQPFALQAIIAHKLSSMGLIKLDANKAVPSCELYRQYFGNQYRMLNSFELETELKLAIDKKEFDVYYQAIVSLATGKLTGFEALVRWHHPQKGTISPIKFIPLAEKSDLILSIGEFVLHKACQQLAIWQRKYPQIPLTISVNVSQRQFANTNLLAVIDNVLTKTALDGKYMKIEITESLLAENNESIRQVFLELQKRNINLCLDDFGTGYSSLGYLLDFPLNILKIDRCFIKGIEKKPKNIEVIDSIITLAHNLGLEVIAEGIETMSQWQTLKKLNCEQGQGYLFSKPLTCKQAEILIESQD